MRRCLTCGGSGIVTNKDRFSGLPVSQSTCYTCGGTGQMATWKFNGVIIAIAVFLLFVCGVCVFVFILGTPAFHH
jgi:hypothetical protein